MADAGSAVFRAVADFSRLRREAKQSRKELAALRGETTATGNAMGQADKSANRFSRTLTKMQGAAKESTKQVSGLKDKTTATGKAMGETDKSSNRLVRTFTALHSAAGWVHTRLDNFSKSRAGATFDRISDSAGRMLATFGKATAGVAAIGLISSAATAAVGPVLGLAGGIAALSGAAGALPGVLGAAGLAVGAVKLAFSGFGEAMKALGEDTKTFEEAIKNLPPAMQGAARAVRKLKPAFDQMKRSVQQTFWQGLGPMISDIGSKYMPVLSRGLQTAAKAANGFVTEIGGFLKTGPAFKSLDGAVANLEKGFNGLKGVGEDLASVFVDIFAVSSEFIPGMGKGISDATGRFRNFIAEARKTGQLKEWIQTGLDQLKALGRSLANIGSMFGSVFKAGQKAGAGFFTTMEKVTGQMAGFLKSTEGQSALTSFFAAVGRAADVIIPIIKELVTQLGRVLPIFVDIGERVGPGVQKVIQGLGDAFVTARPGLEKLGDAFGRFLSAVGGAGPLIGQLVNGLANVLAPVLDAVSAVLEVLTGLFNALPGPVQSVIGKIGGFAAALGIALVATNKLLKVGKSAAAAIKGIGEAAKWAAARLGADGLAGSMGDSTVAGGGAVDGKNKKGGRHRKVKSPKVRGFGLLGKLAGVASIGAAFGMGADAMQGFQDGAMSKGEATRKGIGASLMGAGGVASMFGPWGMVAGAALAAAGFIVDNWDSIGPKLQEAWNWVVDAGKTIWGAFTGWLGDLWTGIQVKWQDTWNAISTFFSTIWNWISTTAQTIWGGITGFFSMLWNGISTAAVAAWNWVGQTLTSIWNWITNTARTIWNGVATFFTNLWNGIKTVATNVWNGIKNVLSTVWNWLANTARSIWNGIKNVISTVWNGIRTVTTNVWNGIKGFLSGAWNGIKNVASNVWNGIKTVASNVWNGIKNTISGAVRSVKNVISNVWGGLKSVVSNIWNGVKNTISGAWDGIKNVVGGAVDWVKNRLSDMWEGVKNVGRGIGNAISFVVPGLASGGWVGGTGRGDTQLRALDPREFVMNPKAAARWGPLLEAMNRDTGGSTELVDPARMAGSMVSNAAGGDATLGRVASLNALAEHGAARQTAAAAAGGTQIGTVQVIQHVSNPLPEKPSVTLTNRVARLARRGLSETGTR